MPSPNLLRNPLSRFFNFEYKTFTFSGYLFQSILLSKNRGTSRSCNPPNHKGLGFRLFPVRSSLTKGISFDFFSSGYLRYFSSPGYLPRTIIVQGFPAFQRSGLPHSDTAGSKLTRQLPDDFRGPCASFFVQTSQGIHYLHEFTYSSEIFLLQRLISSLVKEPSPQRQ